LTRATFGRTVSMDAAEPFAETLKPRGERSLVSGGSFASTFFACVVGHAFDTRDGSSKITRVPPQNRADHTDWVYTSQELYLCGK
jgi:hypothetical protein